MLKEAPFSGNLIEIENRAHRIEFVRTVIQLTREGEFPHETRVLPYSTFILTTLSNVQIADVCAAMAHGYEDEPTPEAAPVGAFNRPRSRRIPEEKKELILKRLAAHVSPAIVAREVQLPYQSVYYYLRAARLQRNAEAGD